MKTFSWKYNSRKRSVYTVDFRKAISHFQVFGPEAMCSNQGYGGDKLAFDYFPKFVIVSKKENI